MKGLRSSWLLLAFCAAWSVAGVATTEAQPVVGFVDLHSHLKAEHAFGGGWFWGTVEGPIDWAVRRCDGNFPYKSHAATMFPIVSECHLGADTGWHLGRRRGYDRRRCRYFFGIPIPGTCPRPHFEDWPDVGRHRPSADVERVAPASAYRRAAGHGGVPRGVELPLQPHRRS